MLKLKLIISILFLLFLSNIAIILANGDVPYYLDGFVYNEQQQPIDEASLYIVNIEFNNVPFSSSNSTGYFFGIVSMPLDIEFLEIKILKDEDEYTFFHSISNAEREQGAISLYFSIEHEIEEEPSQNNEDEMDDPAQTENDIKDNGHIKIILLFISILLVLSLSVSIIYQIKGIRNH